MADDTGAQVAPLLTPINLVLISLFVVLIYLRIRPRPPPSLPKAAPPTLFQTFTPPELLPYNGEKDMPVYLAIRGRIFDVTRSKNFYGPGGPYENFAGRDATRGLACGSFEEDMLTKDLQGPLDDIKDLGNDEIESLRNWEEMFTGKYSIVGKLVPVGGKDA